MSPPLPSLEISLSPRFLSQRFVGIESLKSRIDEDKGGFTVGKANFLSFSISKPRGSTRGPPAPSAASFDRAKPPGGAGPSGRSMAGGTFNGGRRKGGGGSAAARPVVGAASPIAASGFSAAVRQMSLEAESPGPPSPEAVLQSLRRTPEQLLGSTDGSPGSPAHRPMDWLIFPTGIYEQRILSSYAA